MKEFPYRDIAFKKYNCPMYVFEILIDQVTLITINKVLIL